MTELTHVNDQWQGTDAVNEDLLTVVNATE